MYEVLAVGNWAVVGWVLVAWEVGVKGRPSCLCRCSRCGARHVWWLGWPAAE